MTELETQKSEDISSVRWYHIVVACAALVMAIVAIFAVLRRFDLSLMGNTFNLEIASGCEGSSSLEHAKFFGVYEDEYFAAGTKKVKTVKDEAAANFQVVKLSGTPYIRLKENGEWKTHKFAYGEEKTYTLEEVEGCKLNVRFRFNG